VRDGDTGELKAQEARGGAEGRETDELARSELEGIDRTLRSGAVTSGYKTEESESATFLLSCSIR
jgi:hypothetical protein